MIIDLKLNNFKSHPGTDLEFRPLTVLTGINGCGKTSVLQSLLLLRQSFQKGRLDDGLDLNNPLCEIGVADDALYKLSKDGKLTFTITDDKWGRYMFQYLVNPGRLTESFLEKSSYSDNVKRPNLERMSMFNEHFQYVSAARLGGVSDYGKDTYTVERLHQISASKGMGELAGHYLYKFGGLQRYDYLKNDDSTSSLLEQVVQWESIISPGVTLSVEQSSGNNGYAIRYGFNGNEEVKPIDNLKAENVGFGISYTLPILLALIGAEPGDLLLLENPEAHLHPAGQACLARLISLVTQRGVQVIVETHSDHIINGIRVHSKMFEKGQKGISREKVVIYYFGGKDRFHASEITRIDLLSDGRLSVQPNGFFDQDLQDYSFLAE